jgi:hypothetical protein
MPHGWRFIRTTYIYFRCNLNNYMSPL